VTKEGKEPPGLVLEKAGICVWNSDGDLTPPGKVAFKTEAGSRCIAMMMETIGWVFHSKGMCLVNWMQTKRKLSEFCGYRGGYEMRMGEEGTPKSEQNKREGGRKGEMWVKSIIWLEKLKTKAGGGGHPSRAVQTRSNLEPRGGSAPAESEENERNTSG